MRLVLVLLALALLLLTGWRLSQVSGPLPTEGVPLKEGRPRTEVEAAESALANIVARPEAVIATADRESLQAAVVGVERPTGFGELIVRVMSGGKPEVGANVHLAQGVDALLNGIATEDGKAMTDGRGEVAFFVRPTRTVRVLVSSPGKGWTSEGTFTTPFEGRRRVVVLELSPAAGGGSRTVTVTSELDGAPLAGARVAVESSRGGHVVEAETDSEGVARVPGSGRQTYEVKLDGFATHELSAAEDELEIRVELRPLTTFHGQLVMNREWGLELAVRYGKQDNGSTRVGPGGRVEFAPNSPVSRPSQGKFRPLVLVDSQGALSVNGGAFQTFVQSDGSWSAEVAISRALEEWTDVVFSQITPTGTRRTFAVIPRARPGDVILVQDPWGAAPPASLRFQSPVGEPVAGGLEMNLKPAGGRSAGEKPVLTARIRADGAVHLAHLPQQVWDYSVRVPGLPKAWMPSGSFQHNGYGESIVLTQTGIPLEVRVVPKEESDPWIAHLALVEPGRSAETLFTLDSRRVSGAPAHVFPLVPIDKASELVLYVPKKPDGDWLVIGGRNYSVRELLRVPVAPGQREIVLRP